MLLIYYAEIFLLFFVILNTLMHWSILHEFKHFVMVEIRCIHIWSLTTISTFSLLSNLFPWIVTFFAPQNSVPVLLHHACPCCASPTIATVVTVVPSTCLNSVRHFLMGIRPHFAITKQPCEMALNLRGGNISPTKIKLHYKHLWGTGCSGC
jgi:hypothetical protein